MFTGIVAAIGTIESVTPIATGQGGVRLRLRAGDLGCDDIAIGDSVAVNGVCLTVVAIDGEMLEFEVSAETLRCTTGLDALHPVNLEKALRFGDRLGGHLVAGHVDAVGTVQTFVRQGESHLLEVAAPSQLARFIATKGSITIDGVSLTVNAVDGATFAVNLIPHTLAVTTLGQLRRGQSVNLEVDLLARYVDRLLAERA